MTRTTRPLALVTGGGRRLGRAFALALGRAGYDVALSFHSSGSGARGVVDELVGDAGADAAAYHADLRDPSDVEGLVEAVEGEMGPVALLVNSAAHLEHSEPGVADLEAFERAMQLNARAPYQLGMLVGARMAERGEGAIVNVGSTGATRPYRKHVPYGMSKAALLQLTRALALSFAPTVRVNALSPSTVEFAEEPAKLPMPSAQGLPLGRHATPRELTAALLYLARAHYVTGQTLVVDGGWSLGASIR